MDSLRVAIITPEYPPRAGGVGIAVRRIATNFAKTSLIVPHVFVLDREAGGTESSMHMDKGVSVHRICTKKFKSLETSANKNTAVYEVLRDAIKECSPDLINAFYVSHTGFASGLIAKELGIPFVSSFRGNDLHQDLMNASYFSYVQWCLENSDVLTFVSEQAKFRAIALSKNINVNRTRVIWNSIDASEFEGYRRLTEYSLKSPVLCSIGRFRRTKGTDFLLEAFARLEAGTLLLIGDFVENEKAHWQDLLKASPSSLQVIVSGFVPHGQVLSYIDLADIVVFPSRFEGCSNAFLEAMFAGKPIICTDVGAMGDILSQSAGGIVLDRANSIDLHDAITKLLSYGDGPVMGVRNKEYVLSRLTVGQEMHKWLDCYHLALKSDDEV